MNLWEILDDFNSTVSSWRRILDNIDEAVLSYNEALADPTEENPAIFLQECLPEYWQAVRAININRWEKEERLPINLPYDVGIFLIGFSSLPIVLSIAEIQPGQEIYFIHSNDTFRKCDEITNRLTEMLEDPPSPFIQLINETKAESLIARVRDAKRWEITDPSDPVSTFKQIKDIIDDVRGNLGNNVKIALDLTGGKKTMIGGGFTVGSIYSVSPKCDMFYVDSLEYNPDFGAPRPGTEFLSRLDNPYDVYNVQTVAQAKELYKRHNYEVAEGLWSRVRNNLYKHVKRYDFLVNEREEAEKYYGSSHCYSSWDALDYETAKERKTYSVDRTTYSWGYDEQHVSRITDNRSIDVLNILATVTNKSTLYANERRVIHYAVDRYQNGMRRRQNRRLEDAIVRFAQVIEIICNYRIYRLAEDNYFVGIGSCTPITLPADKIWDFAHLMHVLFGGRRGREDIGRTTYHVLPAHQMQAEDYGYTDVEQIIEVIQPRNNFIHFNSPMRQAQAETDAENLRDLAYKFLEKFIGDYCGDYFSENSLSLDCLLELHRFRRGLEK
jgi:hypothetical protein